MSNGLVTCCQAFREKFLRSSKFESRGKPMTGVVASISGNNSIANVAARTFSNSVCVFIMCNSNAIDFAHFAPQSHQLDNKGMVLFD